jgi:imidazolonepropionase-like amidohydrolase
MKILISIFVLSVISISVFCQAVTITPVNVVDVRNGKILSDMTVVCERGLITQVGKAKATKAPAGSTVIDGQGKYLLPGMTDAHMHFFQSGSLYTRPDALNLTNVYSYEKEMVRGNESIADYFSRYLRLGITTIVDVGGPFRNFVVRDSIARANQSPNVLVTGPLFSMVDNPETTWQGDAPILKVTTIEAADSLLEKMLPLKPDFIKIWYIVTPDLPAEKTLPVVRYIAEKTHQANLKLAVHATQLNTATLAVDAGADILVHSIDDAVIPATLIRRMKEKNVSLIPTLIVLGNYYKTFSGRLDHSIQDLAFANPFMYGSLTDLEWISGNHLPPYLKNLRKHGIPKSLSRTDSMMAVNLKVLADAKVNIVAGTDAGNIGTMHGSSYLQELKAMQAAGLTIPQILQSATMNAAKAFGTSGGVIEKGKQANMVLLTQNPLTNLDHLNSIEVVVVRGTVYKADTLIQESPEMLVQRQLNAYNARNLEAFLDTYAEDIELYEFPDKLMSKGKDAMRKQYGSMFSQLKYLHCKIEERIVIGNKVIDHENVVFNENRINAVAIYEVADGLIRKVTFLK